MYHYRIYSRKHGIFEVLADNLPDAFRLFSDQYPDARLPDIHYISVAPISNTTDGIIIGRASSVQ